MTPQEAAAKLKRLLGKHGAWRVDPKAPRAEERAAASARVPELRDKYEAAKKARDARAAEVLRADDEYQRLKAAAASIGKERELASSEAHRYRITVGIDKGWCFSVQAEGDNWADVIRKLEAKAQVSA